MVLNDNNDKLELNKKRGISKDDFIKKHGIKKPLFLFTPEQKKLSFVYK